jgi:predicted ATPase
VITQVHIKNFRGIGDQTVDLGQLTVLVGRNGAGKSSFVDALQFIRDAMTVGLEDAIVHRHGVASLRRWAPTRPYDIEIALTWESRTFHAEYSFVVASGKEGGFRVKHESCEVGIGNSTDRFERAGNEWTNLPGGATRSGFRRPLESTTLALPAMALFSISFGRLRRVLRDMSFFTVFPNTLRDPQKPSSQNVLADHGENLATVIRKLKKSSMDEIQTALEKVVGGIDDIRVQHVGGFLVTELKHRMGGNHTTWFDLSQESDGTLRMLGLLVALYQRPRSDFLAIEEPELTLHPGAIGVLSDVLREAAARGQLLITTQSPDLISRFDAQQLRIVERTDGLTCIGEIDETQRSVIEDQLFSAGDLLRIEGLRRRNSPPPVTRVTPGE